LAIATPKIKFVSQFFLFLTLPFEKWAGVKQYTELMQHGPQTNLTMLLTTYSGQLTGGHTSRAPTNLIWGTETSCMMEYVEGKARCPLCKPRGIGLHQSKGPSKRPWKNKTLHAEWHQLTTCKLCFNIEQWKTTSCLPSKPCVGWLWDFVITSWCEFLKISTFKQPGIWVSIERLKISAGWKF